MGRARPGGGAPLSGLQLVSLLAAAVLVFWVIGAYNRLVALRMAIGSAWAQFEEPFARREQIVGPLAVQLRAPLDGEHSALDALVVALAQARSAADAVRARPVRPAALATFQAREAQLTAALARVQALAEQSTAAHEDVATAELLAQLGEAQLRMAAARRWFNDAAAAYDAAIAQWPTRLLVPLFRFNRAGRL
ncbi:MAG TPA: LemA family protein [Burkholderiaceae bacterium]|nr:LemA family protein [Burkholderiaceae bacterium]